MTAVSQQYLNQPESLVVTLSAETFDKGLKGEQPENTTMKEVAKPSLPPEKAVGTAETPDNEEMVAPEKPDDFSEVEKMTDAPSAAETVPPPPGEAMAELARSHHIIAIHTRAFVESTSQSLQKALRQEIARDSDGDLKEGTAQITFYFDDNGGIGQVWGSSESEKLKALIARIDWLSMPPPGAFRLRMPGLRVMIKIEQGEPALFFAAL